MFKDCQTLCTSQDPHFRGIEFFNSQATGDEACHCLYDDGELPDCPTVRRT